ncbi:MAG: YscO family type III secretion system apparatus protein [Armatimonadetes bacterium]|nr:YscO family type III secretion system apparatus protein [Armatimonadota bacterium]MCX7968950.1 YscO family type III secretion system apparatus protein [Armatimonadota bacterium]MDW8143110.1 YscO family type III secretion system apparatus protein [Armatimonadota bacterium]
MKLALVSLSAVSLISFAIAQPISVDQLQAEIASLRQIVAEKSAELEKLQQQLKRLEEALQSVQKKQQEVAKTTNKFSGLTVGGYIQVRYRRDTSLPVDATKTADGSARENFWISRARLDIRWTPHPGVLARWHVDAAQTRLRTYDAYLELKNGDGIFTMGQFKVPLMEEVLESASVLLTPERSRAAETLFPGNRDRGIALTWRKEGMPTVTLALLSGTRARDTGDSLTTRKSWLVRVVQPLGKFGQVWVGMVDGKGRADTNNDGALETTYDRERKLVGLLLTPVDRLSLRAEWLIGKGSDRYYSPTTRIRGGYIQVSYRLPNLPLTIYAKRDEFDPDRDQPDDTFTRNALGVQWDLNPATRLNLTWEKQHRPNATVWTFQTQVRY